jgi:hypothetical protein
MDYQKVFDITEAGYKSWSFPAHGLILVAVGAVLVLLRRRLAGRWGRHRRYVSVFTLLFFGFAVFWTLTAFFATYFEYARLRQAIEGGRISVVEGIVGQFKPMPVTGHAMERFCVRDKCFEYSDYVITGGFNNTTSHGGPIREGLPVRVTFVGNTIVKLEIAR